MRLEIITEFDDSHVRDTLIRNNYRLSVPRGGKRVISTIAGTKIGEMNYNPPDDSTSILAYLNTSASNELIKAIEETTEKKTRIYHLRFVEFKEIKRALRAEGLQINRGTIRRTHINERVILGKYSYLDEEVLLYTVDETLRKTLHL